MRHILSLSRFTELTLLLFTPALMADSISPYLDIEFDLKLNRDSGTYLSQQSYHLGLIQFNQLQFDLSEKTTSISMGIDENANNPITQAQSFKLTNWDNEYLPLLNNVPLNVSGKSLALSISDDEKHFVLATDKETVLFSSTGKRLWHHIETDTTISTLISVDKKFVISLFNNGVLRWLNYADGTSLFSLYISPETHDWIIWNPQGYYDTSSSFFNPLRFNTATSTKHSLAQLREQLFSPEKITDTLTGDNNPSNNISFSTQALPEVSFKVKDDLQVNICIRASQTSPHDTVIAFNGVTVSRNVAEPVNNEAKASSDCQFKTQTTLSRQNNINSIHVSAVSKRLSTRSKAAIIKTGYKSSHPVSDNTVIIIPRTSRHTKLASLFNNEHRIELPVNQAIQKLDNSVFDSFVLYLAADCNILENDISLHSRDGRYKIKLSQLSHQLQNVNIIDSLVAIDCVVTSNMVNTLTAKRHIYNFIADTGRSLIAQFITKEQLKSVREKQSALESVVIDALQGEADHDDDLLIDSAELLDYIKQNLPLKNFELSGDQGVFYIYKDRQNNFNLPIKLQAQ